MRRRGWAADTERTFSFPASMSSLMKPGPSWIIPSSSKDNKSAVCADLQLRHAVAESRPVYREGDITLEGKKRHVVLIDFNSNGRFDDEIKLREDVHMRQRPTYPEQGDMLLIDPKRGQSEIDHTTLRSYRHYVSKLVDIDGRFYELKISPAGDKLTLTPSTVPLGT